MEWPETVPVELRAADMIKGKFRDGERRCLRGWIVDTFKFSAPICAANSVLLQECRKLTGPYHSGSLIQMSDRYLTLAEAARAWNNAMRELRYTEVTDA